MTDTPYAALIEAIKAKDAAKVQDVLIAHPGMNLEEGVATDDTPLHAAIATGDADCVRLLLEAGANPNSQPRQWGKGTPLLHALDTSGVRMNPKVIALLLKHGANPETTAERDFDKKPLLVAAGKGYEAVVQMLLEKGADIHVKDRYDSTPMILAAREGHSGVIRILAEEGADVNERGWLDMRSPLESALWGGQRDAFETLLDIGANPYDLGQTKSTPLMIAAGAGDAGVFERLVQMGFTLDAQNVNGDTAAHLAAWSGRGNSFARLLEMGADMTIKNGKGLTARDVAESEGHVHILRQLAAHDAKLAAQMNTGLQGGINISKPLRLTAGPA